MDKLKGLAISDTGFVFDPMTGFTYSLNKTGVFILKQLREGLSPDEIVQKMVEKFEVEEEVAREDLARFVDKLKEYGLL